MLPLAVLVMLLTVRKPHKSNWKF